MKNILIFLILVSAASCSSYVKKVHKNIDRENDARRRGYMQQARRGGDNRPIQNPVTLGGRVSSASQRNYMPAVKRNYGYGAGKPRYRSSDFQDNASDGSLWSGKNTENFLFITNNLKRRGDIVILEVMNSLKDKIQDELKRTFPDRKKKSKTAKKEEKPKVESVAGTQPEAATNKVHDKISTTVVEVVNQDYLLIRGQKEVMFKKRKRFVEIQTVVSQKDVTSSDTVSSEKVLETKVNVMRY